MLTIQLHRGAARLHERVLESCFDPLATHLADLHRPFFCDGAQPTCHGCDTDGPPGEDEPIWPCRTYTAVAKSVLRIMDVENCLTELARTDKLESPPG